MPRRPEGELSLLDAALAGNPKAWSELVVRFGPALRTPIEALGLPADQVGDVVSEVWLHLLEDDMRRLRAFRATHRAPFANWIATIAAEVARQHPRARPVRRGARRRTRRKHRTTAP